ncbi:MAG: hypothetical protein O7D94_10575, partial [Planctomycetota bacterium]|nr:hypothetical protein [Planctomycetota bacterium]
RRQNPREEPGALAAHAGICAGGAGQPVSLPRQFVERATRLYEQEREEPDGPSLLGLYVRRWSAWACGGLNAALDSPGALALCPPPRRRARDQTGAEQRDRPGLGDL